MPPTDRRRGARRTRPAPSRPASAAVAEVQRQRILGATAEVVAEHGAGAVTVAHIVARAGVSRRTFYEQFPDREACFLAAFDEAIGRVSAAVLPQYEAAQGWRERLRAGLAALLGFLDANPGARALLVVEVLGAGPVALERRARIMDALIAAVDEGRAEMSKAPPPRPPAQPPPLTAEGVVGAVFAVLHARAAAGVGPPQRRRQVAPLIDLLGELMGMIVLPYLGVAAARRETERPAPAGAGANHVLAGGNPLEGLNMRLTYRTICVLAAVAQHPGASNRDVGAAAGMTDQGQISKLLNRLLLLGLLENAGDGHPRGGANAWRLSERGEQVEQALRG
ncbi:MAG TPA: TetR/AcrR family transcriptional regulator [Solirubrobacteraceae bacterium]|jgi:AcrR family transcriptional regulator